MALFRYVTREGSFEKDTYPMSGVQELTLQRNAVRFQQDGIRSHESHPLHEKAMSELPGDLIVLRLDGTKVRTFPRVPTTLEELYADYNYFIRIPDLAYATNLQVMNLGDGRIEGFDGALPPRLHTLDLRNNSLSLSAAPAALAQGDINVQLSGNPMYKHGIRNQRAGPAAGGKHIDYGPGTAAAIRAAYAATQHVVEPVRKNIYKNGQNVHDSGVQNSTSKNIHYLMDKAKRIRLEGEGKYKLAGDSILVSMNHAIKDYKKRTTKPSILQSITCTLFPNKRAECNQVQVLRDFLKNPYAMHGVTFNEFLNAVWICIDSEKNLEMRDELIGRFCEEVKDGEYRCTGGMIVRLCNIFIGFDENITIQLRPADILQSRIPATMERIRKEMKVKEGAEPREYWVRCIKETEKDLKDVELPEGMWAEWLQPMFEPIADEILEALCTTLGKKWHTEEHTKLGPIFERFSLESKQWMIGYLRTLPEPHSISSAPPADIALPIPSAPPIDIVPPLLTVSMDLQTFE